MYIKIIRAFKGQEAGQPVKKYLAGEGYHIHDAALIDVIFANNWGVEDVFAGVDPFSVPTVVAEPQALGFPLSDSEISLLPVKKLKAIIKDEGFLIDTQSVTSQVDLANAVIAHIKMKYKGAE